MEWLRAQWNDIKGNVKYGLLLSVLFIVGVITRGLTWWQQSILAFVFVCIVTWAVLQTLKADRLSRQLEKQSEDKPTSLSPSPQPQPLKRQLFIFSRGCALRVSGNAIYVYLQILSTEPVELVFARAELRGPGRDGGQWFLAFEDSEPMALEPMAVTMKSMMKVFPADEMKNVTDRAETISGYLKFRYAQELQTTTVQFNLSG